jgi:hypothetical protein
MTPLEMARAAYHALSFEDRAKLEHEIIHAPGSYTARMIGNMGSHFTRRIDDLERRLGLDIEGVDPLGVLPNAINDPQGKKPDANVLAGRVYGEVTEAARKRINKAAQRARDKQKKYLPIPVTKTIKGGKEE